MEFMEFLKCMESSARKDGNTVFMPANNHENIFQHSAFIMCVFCSTTRDKRTIYVFFPGVLKVFYVVQQKFVSFWCKTKKELNFFSGS